MSRFNVGNNVLSLGLLACMLAGAASAPPPSSSQPAASDAHLRLGNFSVSLTVKDLAASRAFYEKLGFKMIGGNAGAPDAARGMIIMQNDSATIGLFKGMFDKNVFTFNPGWDRAGKTLTEFDDVRDIQRALKSRGLTLSVPADESSTGPAGIVLFDPDGNQILIDQHVPKPKG